MNSSIWPIEVTLRLRVDLRERVMKGYYTFSKLQNCSFTLNFQSLKSQPKLSCTFKIKTVRCMSLEQFEEYVGDKHVGTKTTHDQSTDRIEPLLMPVLPSKGQSGGVKVTWPLWLPAHELLSRKDPVQKNLCRGARSTCSLDDAVGVFYSSKIQGKERVGNHDEKKCERRTEREWDNDGKIKSKVVIEK